MVAVLLAIQMTIPAAFDADDRHFARPSLRSSHAHDAESRAGPATRHARGVGIDRRRTHLAVRMNAAAICGGAPAIRRVTKSGSIKVHSASLLLWPHGR